MLPKNAHKNARMRKAWKEKRDEIITAESVCSRCEKEASAENPLVIHHTTKEAYLEENFHLYETLSAELPYEVICKRCHIAGHHGMILCAVCKERYHHRINKTCYLCQEGNEIQRSTFHEDIHDSLREMGWTG